MGKHCNKGLQAAWIEYGDDDFELVVHEVCQLAQLREREIYWIAKLGGFTKGFNSTPLGAGPDYVTRAKIAAKNKNSNIIGLVTDARSIEGRARRSTMMQKLNDKRYGRTYR